MGRVPALLATGAPGHRRGLRHRHGQGPTGGGLLRRGHHVDGRGGRPAGAGRARDARARPICSSPRRHRPTWTRPTPPPSTPGWDCSPDAGAYDLCGSVRSGWATVQLAALAGARAPALAVVARPAHRPSRWARRDPGRRRCGGLRVRPRRRGHRAAGPCLHHRRVPRPVAGPRRDRPRASGRTASARRPTCRWPARPSLGPSTTPASTAADVDHLIVTGLHARAVASLKKSLGVPGRPAGARSRRPDRQPGGGPGRPAAGRRAGAGRRRARSSWWWRWPTVPTPWCSAPPTPYPAVQDARREAGLRPVAELVAEGRSDLAYAVFLSWRGHAAPGAAPASRSRAARRPGQPAGRRMEVRVQRQPVHGLRVPPPPAHPDLPFVPGRRPDGARADGRPPGHRGHLHHRPPGLQPVAPHGGRGHRLRRRRSLPGRDDRCGPRGRGRGYPGGHDLPPALQRRGRPQLLLEGPAGGRRYAGERQPGRPGEHRSEGAAAS